jgi:myo-inositol-1(or 4)-monophosphatase
MDYLEFIKKILEEAFEIARNNFGKTSSVITKSGDNNQVLTETDLAIGNLIVEKIKEVFPTHNIIDEEAGVIDNKSEFTWVVDPIDGTSNFANGIPLYGVMVGLLNKETPIVGGISLPSFNEIYVAEKGKGVYCNGEQIYATKDESLLKVLVAYGIDGHQENPDITYNETKLLGEIVLNIRNLRSSNSAFDTAMVAKGSYGATLNRTSKIWDNVAQQIILEEAGCTYTDFFGKPIDYSNPVSKARDNFTFCAAPPNLHQALQTLIHKVH